MSLAHEAELKGSHVYLSIVENLSGFVFAKSSLAFVVIDFFLFYSKSVGCIMYRDYAELWCSSIHYILATLTFIN